RRIAEDISEIIEELLGDPTPHHPHAAAPEPEAEQLIGPEQAHHEGGGGEEEDQDDRERHGARGSGGVSRRGAGGEGARGGGGGRSFAGVLASARAEMREVGAPAGALTRRALAMGLTLPASALARELVALDRALARGALREAALGCLRRYGVTATLDLGGGRR